MSGRALLALSVVPVLVSTGTDMTSFEGTWTGGAEIVVSWTVQRMLDVTLVVDSSDNVGGCVGQAALVGRIARNRGTLLRALNWKTDYVIAARLTGPVIAAEEVVRAGIRIPFNLVDGRIEGGIHTTGTKVGGRDSGILSARRLVLRRVDPVSDGRNNPHECATERR